MAKINVVESDAEIIGVIRVKPEVLSDNVYKNDCIILENISDPGNLGTILRLAAATAVGNIIVSSNTVDVYSPKVLRSSAGLQFDLNILTGIDIEKFLNEYTGEILATTPHSQNSIYTTSLKNPIAWVFGNEASGLSEKLLMQLKNKVSIPMPGGTESLNVAMAATIALFEMIRQREYQ